MNNKLLFYIFFIIFYSTQTLFGQQLTEKEFKMLLNNQFTNLITGESQIGFGNYAALDINEGKASLSASFNVGKCQVLSITANGGTSEGLFSIFNNTTFTQTFDLGVKYDFKIGSDNPVTFAQFPHDKFIEDANQVKSDYQAKIEAVKDSADINFLIVKESELTNSLNKTKKEAKQIKEEIIFLNNLKWRRNKELNDSQCVCLYEHNILEGEEEGGKKYSDSSLKVDCIDKYSKSQSADTNCIKLINDKLKWDKARLGLNHFDSITIKKSIDSVSKVLNKVSKDSVRTKIAELETQKDNELSELEKKFYEKPGVKEFQMGWLTVGINFQNNNFDFLKSNDENEFNLQKKTNTESIGGNLQYSYYNYILDQSETYYYDCGLEYTYGDDISEMKKLEVTESRNYGTIAGDTIAAQKNNVLFGDYSKYTDALKLYGDFFWFLGQRVVALHLYPEYSINSSLKPESNLGFGVFKSFSGKDSESAIVNTEIYFNVLDLSNNNDDNNGFFESNELGIRLAFPIDFKL